MPEMTDKYDANSKNTTLYWLNNKNKIKPWDSTATFNL